MQLTLLTCDTGTEAAGKQGDYYDPLFTYQKGDEASYFVVSEDSEGDAAGIGPSGVGVSKESPMTSSSRGWFIEPSANEGEPDIPVMEAARIDEILPEVTVTARVSSMEPAEERKNKLATLEERIKSYEASS